MKKEYHKIACAAYLVLVDEDKVLLLRRFNTGYEDGNYSLPAGHVDKGESAIGTVVRETSEEIGVTIDPKDVSLGHVMHRRAGPTNDERIDFFFICSRWVGEIINQEPHKCDELTWFLIDKLPPNTIPYIKIGIEGALQTKTVYSES